MPTSIDHRHVVRVMSLGRVAIGIVLLVTPGLAGRQWIGAVARDPATKVAIRALGIRDLAIGLGTLRAVDAGDDSLRQWVTLGGVCDLVDAGASALGTGSMPLRGRVLGVVMGAGAAAASFVARDRLG